MGLIRNCAKPAWLVVAEVLAAMAKRFSPAFRSIRLQPHSVWTGGARQLGVVAKLPPGAQSEIGFGGLTEIYGALRSDRIVIARRAQADAAIQESPGAPCSAGSLRLRSR